MTSRRPGTSHCSTAQRSSESSAAAADVRLQHESSWRSASTTGAAGDRPQRVHPRKAWRNGRRGGQSLQWRSDLGLRERKSRSTCTAPSSEGTRSAGRGGEAHNLGAPRDTERQFNGRHGGGILNRARPSASDGTRGRQSRHYLGGGRSGERSTRSHWKRHRSRPPTDSSWSPAHPHASADEAWP